MDTSDVKDQRNQSNTLLKVNKYGWFFINDNSILDFTILI